MRVRAKQTKLSIVVERPHANAKKEKLRQPARRNAKKKRAASRVLLTEYGSHACVALGDGGAVGHAEEESCSGAWP